MYPMDNKKEYIAEQEETINIQIFNVSYKII